MYSVELQTVGKAEEEKAEPAAEDSSAPAEGSSEGAATEVKHKKKPPSMTDEMREDLTKLKEDQAQNKYVIWSKYKTKEELKCYDKIVIALHEFHLQLWFQVSSFYFVDYIVPRQMMIIIAIVGNTIVLSMDHYNIDEVSLFLHLWLISCLQDWAAANDGFNLFFTFLFLGELIVKFIGLGPKAYFPDTFNRFDFVVVMFSMIELAVGSEGGALTALRAFRLLRVFKLLRSWHGLRTVLNAVLKSGDDLFNFSLILCLFIYVFAVFGMQLFYGYLEMSLESRASFDGFGWSALTVFQIATGENWNDVMVSTVDTFGMGYIQPQ